MFNKDSKDNTSNTKSNNTYKRYLNPFLNNDIQPGVSPEIIDEIPFPDSPPKQQSFFKSLFGYQKPAKNDPSLKETYTHSIYETMQSISSRILPVSNSNINGHLTRDEFIKAGDYLVQNNSNWEWAFEPENMNINFPPDKQYLVNRGLICDSRVVIQKEDRVHLDMKRNELWSCPDPNTNEKSETHIYDISLTYDTNTRTPRVWLVGYTEDGATLPMEEVAQDINIEFVGTVATMIPHPFTNVLNVSIHPCRHAEGMAKIIDRIDNDLDTEYQPQEYLIYFLQLIACIFPTIHIS